jgi:hypothetical protein
MRKVRILKQTKEMLVGEVYELGNNESWYLVNEGIAEYVRVVGQEKLKLKKTKEMVARKRKLYVTK